MDLYTASIVEAFDRAFPPDVQRALLRLVYDAYRTAEEIIGDQYEPPEASDLLPYARRAEIEKGLRGIASRYSNILEASTERNAARNSNHVCLEGGRVALTASRVDGPDALVRKSLFRQGYAAQQGDFFRPDPPKEAPLYALLLHAPMSGRPDDLNWTPPAFARIAFPDRSLESYVANFDLAARFPDVVADVTAVAAGPTTEATPTMRPPVITPKKDSGTE